MLYMKSRYIKFNEMSIKGKWIKIGTYLAKKNDIIQSIIDKTERNPELIKIIYDAIEDEINSRLLSVNEDQDVKMQVFDGIWISGTYMPPRFKQNNLVGENQYVKAKIKVKADASRRFKDKINRIADKNKNMNG